MKAERERLKDFWSVHWAGGKLYHLRLSAGGPNVDGQQLTAPASQYGWLLRSRVDDVVGVALPKYQPIRVRPFTFLAQRTELIGPAADVARVDHPLIDQFTVIPRFVLSAKTFKPVDGQSKLGIFVNVEMQFDITAPLNELQNANVDLAGLHVVRRQPEPGKRRLVGRISRVDGNVTQLSEGIEGPSIDTDLIKLEGSKESVARCLTTILGLSRYRGLMSALDDEQARYLLGPDFDEVVTKLGALLSKTKLPIALGQDAKIGDRIVLANSDTAQAVYVAPPVDYVFGLPTHEAVVAACIDFAIGLPAGAVVGDLEQDLLQRLLAGAVGINDEAEAAGLLILANRISDRISLSSPENAVEQIVVLCRRFPLFVERLRTRQRQRVPLEKIKDEYDVQDLLHAILKLHFDDVRPEEVTPSYAGSSSRVDFHLPNERIVVEAKMTRSNLGQKEVADELIIDANRYRTVPGVETLICLVYDPEKRCQNPTALERDVEASGVQLRVRAVVCPHGL